MKKKNGEKTVSRIALLRKEYGWSQQELSDRLSMNRRTVASIESGVYTLHNLIAIADLFNVSVDYILERTDERGYVPECKEDNEFNIWLHIQKMTSSEKKRLLKHLELENSLKDKNGK